MVALKKPAAMAAALGLSPVANAANYDVRFCFQINVDFADNEGYSAGKESGDYWADNDNDVAARGVSWKVETNTIPPIPQASGTAKFNGSHIGCTATHVTLSSLQNYRITVESTGLVRGNTINSYEDSRDAIWLLDSYTWSPFTPSSNGVENLSPIPTTDEWNNYAVAAWALSRFDGAMNNTWDMFANEHPVNGGNQQHDGDIWAPSNNKFVIAHELGHAIGYFADEGENELGAPGLGECLGNVADAGGRNIASREYHSEAATEGWAHFYAAVTWNNVSQSDCDFGFWTDVNWNLDNIGDETPVGDELPEGGDPNGPDFDHFDATAADADWVLTCEGDPTDDVYDPPLEGFPWYDWIQARDWLDEVATNVNSNSNIDTDVNPYPCSNSGNDGSIYN